MRTGVSLEAIGALVEGRHENPFAVLGPHEIVDNGRRALAVRAFLPNTRQVWLLDKGQGVSRPMRRIHPAGLYETVCPTGDDTPIIPYEFRVVRDGGEIANMQDPYRFPSYLSDFDFYLIGEGNHTRLYERFGASAPLRGRRRRSQLLRLGAECTKRGRRRRLQSLGWPRASHAEAHSQRHLGTVHSRTGARCQVQVPREAGGLAKSSTRPIRTALRPNCRRGRRRSSPTSPVSLERRPVDGPAPANATVGQADFDLRSPSRQLAAHGRSTPRLDELPRSGASRWWTTARRWATRTSNCCRSASIRLPAAGAIRPSAITRSPAATARPKTSCTSSTTAISTALA